MVNNHPPPPPIATPFNNVCPKTLSNQARDNRLDKLKDFFVF